MNNDLAARLDALESIEAIRQLKAEYCDICDDAHDPDRIVTIFTEDGIWEARGTARAEGHRALRKLFEGFARSIKFSQHMVFNPRIQVDDDSAVGKWYFLGMFTFYGRDGEPNKARWQTCRYEETYRRVDGVWKIAHLRVRGPSIAADHDKGWAGIT